MDKEQNERIGVGESKITIHDWASSDYEGNHKSSDEIEQDIYETRHSMDILLDAIGGKFHPRNMVDRFLDYFQNTENRHRAKDAIQNVTSHISDSFQRNPLPILLLSTGAIWMLRDSGRTEEPNYKVDYRSKADRLGEQTSEKFGSIRDQGSKSLDSTKEKLSSGLDAAREKGDDLRSKMQGLGESYKEKSSELKGTIAHSYKEGLNKTDQSIHNDPLLFGAAAAFAGIVAGMLFPSSKPEKDAFGEQSRDVNEAVRETTNEVKQTSQEVVNKAVGITKEKEDLPFSSGVSEKVEKYAETGSPSEKVSDKPVSAAPDLGNKTSESVKIAAQSTKETINPSKPKKI